MCGSAPEWVWLFFRTGVAKRADKCGSVTGIYKAFASLPKDEQSILILRFVLDLTDEEIGRLMGMSRSAVQRHRTSTLKDLRIKLMAFMPEGG